MARLTCGAASRPRWLLEPKPQVVVPLVLDLLLERLLAVSLLLACRGVSKALAALVENLSRAPTLRFSVVVGCVPALSG